MKTQKLILEETNRPIMQSCPEQDSFVSHCSTMEELCRVWLQKQYAAVKKSTYSNYNYHVKQHILPYFGEFKPEKISGDTVFAFITQLQKKGLADTTVRAILVTFKSVVRFGCQCKLLDSDLCSYCHVHCRRQESKALTNRESVRMKEYLLQQNTIFSIGILLCRGTGIRIGELCGLKWGDIDLESCTFKINRTVSRITNPNPLTGQPKTVIYVRPPKSYTSSREIPIPQYLVTALKSMKKEDHLYLLTGTEICTEPRNIQKKFKTLLKKCNMEDCNFHALRHGFATTCLENKIDCKTVSSILGHASTRTTLDYYAHTSMLQKQNCINAIK